MLIDFGITRQLVASGGGTAIGTWGYTPWEQYLGNAEPRSDIYALGATLYALLTSRLPDSEYGRLQRSGLDVETTLRRLFPPLDTLVPNAPPCLAQVLAQATAFDAADRFADADEFSQALIAVQSVATGFASHGAPAPTIPVMPSTAAKASTVHVTPPAPLSQAPTYPNQPPAAQASAQTHPRIAVPPIARRPRHVLPWILLTVAVAAIQELVASMKLEDGEPEQFDLDKLAAMRNELGYRYTLFIRLPNMLDPNQSQRVKEVWQPDFMQAIEARF